MHLEDLRAGLKLRTGWNHDDLAGLATYRADSPDDRQTLKAASIEVSGGGIGGPPNLVMAAAGALEHRLKINFGGGVGSAVVLYEGSRVRGSINMSSGTNLFVCRPAEGRHNQTVDVNMRGSHNAFYFGDRSSSYGLSCSMEGRGNYVTVGSGCMFSASIKIFATDHHAIIDLASGLVINEPQDVAIGNHVWVGANVTIMKGLAIGEGSIIGVGSIVTKDIPAWTAAAGVPARVVRSGVSWSRTEPYKMAGRKWRMGPDYRFEVDKSLA